MGSAHACTCVHDRAWKSHIKVDEMPCVHTNVKFLVVCIYVARCRYVVFVCLVSIREKMCVCVCGEHERKNVCVLLETADITSDSRCTDLSPHAIKTCSVSTTHHHTG